MENTRKVLDLPHARNSNGPPPARPIDGQDTRLHVLQEAILRTLSYADTFDYPLTLEEVHRYLVGVRASSHEIRQALQSHRPAPDRISIERGYLTITGRQHLIDIRDQRSIVARGLWPAAMTFSHVIGQIPFVRMVAVTGALAVNNVEPGGDIDLLIVTKPGRLWSTRLVVIGLVKLAARRRIPLCPNYLLSERALVIHDRNLFIAHELAQMVPLWGMDTYYRMIRENDWVTRFLPNALPAGRHDRLENHLPAHKHLTEWVLKGWPVDQLERWEMRRKTAKFRIMGSGDGKEADFTADWCKGHFQGHGAKTLRRYAERLRELKVAEGANYES